VEKTVEEAPASHAGARWAGDQYKRFMLSYIGKEGCGNTGLGKVEA
jgi:hypothetical protein